MSRVFARAREGPPPEKVLRQLRIPFVRRATMARAEAEEDVFIIDIGLSGAFIEREREMPVNEPVEIRFGWPGSEVPFRAQCRVAWWHPAGSHLVSKSLPPGAGLGVTEMSGGGRGGGGAGRRAAARVARRALPPPPAGPALPAPLAGDGAPGRRPDRRLRRGAHADRARKAVDLRQRGCVRAGRPQHRSRGPRRRFPRRPEDGRVLGAGSPLVLGSPGRRPGGAALLDVRQSAERIAALDAEATASLVFGPETGGLSEEELGLCGRAVTLPSPPAQPPSN